MGHTRWATHGAPIERNAHPHANESMAVAVVENFIDLRRQLIAEGHEFLSDTNTKVTSKQYLRYRPEDGLNVGSFCEQVGNPDDEPGSYYHLAGVIFSEPG